MKEVSEQPMVSSNIVTMPTPRKKHPSDDELEMYVLGRLDEVHTAPVEEHLLVCEPCRERLQEIEEYAVAMRHALVELDVEAGQKEETPWPSRLKNWFAVPMPVWAGAAAALIVLVVFLPVWRSGGERYEAELQAMRGEASAATQQVPADRMLDLRIDVTGLPVSDSYRVEIADAGGQIVLEATSPRTGDALLLSTEQGFERGQYWVRVCELPTSNSATGDLLREFSLRVQ